MKPIREKDIRPALEARLSGLTETPGLYGQVLHLAQAEARPAKRRLSAALALGLALVLTACAALAAGWHGVRYFLEDRTSQPQTIREEAVVQPLAQRCDSRLLLVEAVDACVSDGVFSLTLHVRAASDAQVLCMETDVGRDGERFDMIWWDGEILPLEAWRAGREVLQLCLPTGSMPFDSFDWVQDQEGETLLVQCRCPDEALLQSGGDVTLLLTTENLQTGETERATLTVTLPAMK